MEMSISDYVPKLNLLNYQFGEEHGSALASLLCAAVCGENFENLAQALEVADGGIEFEMQEGSFTDDQKARIKALREAMFDLVEAVEILRDAK